MRKLALTLLLLLALSPLSIDGLQAAGGATPVWPAVEIQLARDHVQPGSALEKLIRENQDFSLLRPEEADDQLLIPLWLRVHWRKAHPEGSYSAGDPTGGYPLALRREAEWMVHHQNLEARPDGIGVALKNASVGTNFSISGTQIPHSGSAIAINPDNPNQILASANTLSSGAKQGMFFSSNGGSTWSQSSLSPFFTGDAFHSGPTADWTSDGTAWSATIGVNSTGTVLKLRSYQSTTGGSTWATDATASGSQSAADKEMLSVDHGATSPFRDTLYVCWHNNNPAYVNRRTSAGWGTPIQVSGAESTGTAIGCDVRANGAGDAFVFWPATGNSKIVVAKSTNGGASWGAGKVIATTKDSFDIGIPALAGQRALIYVAGGAFKNATTNNVYASWTDLTGATGCTGPANEPGTNAASTCKTRIWLARSTDGGITWGAPFMLNNQASLNDQFNPWLAVDPTNGRVGVLYYDTAGEAARQKTNVWYQSSGDGGATWSAPLKLNTSPSDVSGGGSYGDYNGLSGFLGKFFPSWTDHRNSGPTEIWTAPITDP